MFRAMIVGSAELFFFAEAAGANAKIADAITAPEIHSLRVPRISSLLSPRARPERVRDTNEPD